MPTKVYRSHVGCGFKEYALKKSLSHFFLGLSRSGSNMILHDFCFIFGRISYFFYDLFHVQFPKKKKKNQCQKENKKSLNLSSRRSILQGLWEKPIILLNSFPFCIGLDYTYRTQHAKNVQILLGVPLLSLHTNDLNRSFILE